MDLIAGLRQLGAEAVHGYCNHPMLIAAISNATAICSGTWMNVRSFPPEKFVTEYEREIRQRSRWYYCPQALSEYKVLWVDNAFRAGIFDAMAPPEELDGGYVDGLFSGTLPSNADFTEQAAFRHYLHAPKVQAEDCFATTFDAACGHQENLLAEAVSLLGDLAEASVTGKRETFAK